LRFRFYVKLVERTTAKDSTQRAQRKEAQRAQRREERRLVGGGTKKSAERFLDCEGRRARRSERERKCIGLLRSE